MCNSILSGLVAVAASCDRIEPWAAVCIGLVAGLVYAIWCKVLQVIRVDDPCEGSAVFMMNGFWGLWGCGFFDNEFGLFYGDNEKGRYFGYEICGSVVIFGWVSAFAILYFLVMRALRLLRVSKVQEVVGLDVTELGGFSKEDYAKIYQEVKVKIEEEEFGLRKGEANNLVQREHEVINVKQGV